MEVAGTSPRLECYSMSRRLLDSGLFSPRHTLHTPSIRFTPLCAELVRYKSLGLAEWIYTTVYSPPNEPLRLQSALAPALYDMPPILAG